MPTSPEKNVHEPVWKAAEKYLRARKNDVHVPLSYGYARRLLDHYQEADTEVVLLATLLHDIGWWCIDMDDIISKGFGPNMMQSDVRFLHEREGVRLSREILSGLNYPEPLITEVASIIDGHDTRPEPHSLNDRLMRDADKLWRFTPTGVALACDWFKLTPSAYGRKLDGEMHLFETDYGRELAAKTLVETKSALCLHIL